MSLNHMPDQLQIKRFCFPVTLRCNLRCKLCAEQSPYYQTPYHPTVSELIQQVDTLFDITDHVELFDLTGGEPLLRKDLHLLTNYLLCRYGQRIGKLRLTTNGTILPCRELLGGLNCWSGRAQVIVDSYSVSTKVQEISDSLAAAGVPFEVRDYTVDVHCNGWVNYGDLNRKHNDIEAKQLFNVCMVPRLDFFLCLVDGLLFPCARARLLYEKGITQDFLDISAASGTRETRRSALREFLRVSSLDSCAYCNGLCENSERFMPAEQLPTKRFAE